MGKALVLFMNTGQTVNTARGERWFLDLNWQRQIDQSVGFIQIEQMFVIQI